MERELNTTEKKILRLLYQTKASLTDYEVAKELGISYPTAKKYLEILLKEGYIIEYGSEKKKSKNI